MNDMLNSRISIIGLGTALPTHSLSQTDAAKLMESTLGEKPELARFARRIFRSCGVEMRYTCEPSFTGNPEDCEYLPSNPDHEVPSTEERMNTYKKEAVPLGIQAAERALKDSNTAPEAITHLVTVSCTGQFLPGLDVLLIKHLGLSPRTTRIPLIFQGCAAGLRAIQAARDVVQGSPDAKVLVVCVELCTLHFQPVMEREALFAASFFGDGASSCVVSMAEEQHQHYYQLGKGYSVLLPDCAEDMTWDVGNTGFDLYLSPRIPKLLGTHLAEEMDYLLEGAPQPELYAIHPGGRGIVDSVQEVLGLRDDQTKYSRDILKNYGNLSSVTIMFVLDAMRSELRSQQRETAEGVAMAFGPGLTAELMRFSYVPSYRSSSVEADHVYL
ncbi:type III polyketide synthase [Paenibacillus urinalis]|uniref:Type III polyketide synthase n=1 Tax=Paenibacillus urinalis TaxID=521520 RepID=A0AAX3MVV7_9BACL|nr:MULTISPECIES: type III polyketide synthase [Paenibacillus]WDH80959.1 type III polyketide synthase [Paenibacillus urinalis]WDH97012.1 type III polyketide synthase [Paenibacillus urinalis]WDI00674.1 type III polyketide synthase [Paenibacillus urinalis]GAK39341.1 putative chalcone and stilbene synthase [Paenibacillus sp. TCA20]